MCAWVETPRFESLHGLIVQSKPRIEGTKDAYITNLPICQHHCFKKDHALYSGAPGCLSVLRPDLCHDLWQFNLVVACRNTISPEANL